MDKKVTFYMLLTNLAVICSLTACQNSQLKKCRSLNWRALGENVALNGELQHSNFEQHKKACEAFSISSDQTSFDEGYTRGLAMFCTSEKGYDFGQSGKAYLNTCPAKNSQAFLKGYYKGRLQHLKEELTKHTELYAEAEDRLWRKEREYLIIQNEDPEQALLEVDLIDAYREEARLLAEKKRGIKKEILKTKRLSEESFF